jgi:predicted esterase
MKRALSFTHKFVPAAAADAPTLLLLHGTGSDENGLLALGKALAPEAAILSPRGKVLERGAPRFFRRLAEGVFDMEDLHFRTDELAEFVNAAVERYKLDRQRLIAVGYSNGANIAASVLLQRPGILPAVVLFRAMVPFEPDPTPDLQGVRVFMASGRHDPIVPVAQPERLRQILTAAGAVVSIHWHDGGHELGDDDMDAAKRWLKQEVATVNRA